MKFSILVVDDEKASRYITKKLLKNDYVVIEADGKDACLDTLSKYKVHVVVLDLIMPGVDDLELLEHITRNFPDLKVIVLTSVYDVEKAVRAMQLNAQDYIVKEAAQKCLIPAIEKAVKSIRLDTNNKALKDELKQKNSRIFVPNHPAWQDAFKLGLDAAQAGLSILINGDTGSGKDIIAHYIHQQIMPENPLVTVNCGAIAQSISESELFGHEEGSFTDAKSSRLGKIEMANGGILFLDEIGNMPLDIQQKILRVIEDKKVFKVGSHQEVQVDFVLISATNADLESDIKSGVFREDLYYRLKQVIIKMPSINDYPEVIPQFVSFFLNHFNIQYSKEVVLTEDHVSAFKERKWNGNLRELKNEIQTLVALSKGSEPYKLPSLEQQVSDANSDSIGMKEDLRQVERRRILSALESVDYNVSKAARELGIKRTTLIFRIKSLDIEIKK